MFDVSWSELLVIIVVALVVVGPKDLPRLMRTAGQWAGRARAMADQFRRSFDDMARQAELDELRAEVTKLQNDAINSAIIDGSNESLGITTDSPLAGTAVSSAPVIEEVGAAPPKFDVGEPYVPPAQPEPVVASDQPEPPAAAGSADPPKQTALS
jgi:sec-independent protein translocase protein TatB